MTDLPRPQNVSEQLADIIVEVAVEIVERELGEIRARLLALEEAATNPRRAQ